MGLQIEKIKKLRARTGLGIVECRTALEEAEGDIEKALKILALKSKGIAEQKEEREVKEGVISAYIHSNQKIGVLVELLCETDFVARSSEFQKLAHEIALQVAATNPRWLSKNEVPSDVIKEHIDSVRESFKEEKSKKSPEIEEKIVQNKLEQFFRENCLLEQPYIRDESLIINDLIEQKIALFKENIMVGRFVRFAI